MTVPHARIEHTHLCNTHFWEIFAPKILKSKEFKTKPEIEKSHLFCLPSNRQNQRDPGAFELSSLPDAVNTKVGIRQAKNQKFMSIH